MLSLTGEEWAYLNTVPEFQRLKEQLKREIEVSTEELIDGAALNMDSAESSAIKHAFYVGGIRVLKEIVQYKPEDRDGEKPDEQGS